jgi:hypothetical protein
MALSVSIVKVFSPKGKLVQMWPVSTITEFIGTTDDYKRFVLETKCKQVFKRHPDWKPEDIGIDITAKEFFN